MCQQKTLPPIEATPYHRHNSSLKMTTTHGMRLQRNTLRPWCKAQLVIKVVRSLERSSPLEDTSIPSCWHKIIPKGRKLKSQLSTPCRLSLSITNLPTVKERVWTKGVLIVLVIWTEIFRTWTPVTVPSTLFLKTKAVFESLWTAGVDMTRGNRVGQSIESWPVVTARKAKGTHWVSSTIQRKVSFLLNSCLTIHF